MRLAIFGIFVATCCCLALRVSGEDGMPTNVHRTAPSELYANQQENEDISMLHSREKRTLFLKKKLIGAGLLGFGLGIAKGYKAGYRSAPEIHHVYLSPPPAAVKYVQYVEKPIFVEGIVERGGPVFKEAQGGSFPPYGSW